MRAFTFRISSMLFAAWLWLVSASSIESAALPTMAGPWSDPNACRAAALPTNFEPGLDLESATFDISCSVWCVS